MWEVQPALVHIIGFSCLVRSWRSEFLRLLWLFNFGELSHVRTHADLQPREGPQSDTQSLRAARPGYLIIILPSAHSNIRLIGLHVKCMTVFCSQISENNWLRYICVKMLFPAIGPCFKSQHRLTPSLWDCALNLSSIKSGEHCW